MSRLNYLKQRLTARAAAAEHEIASPEAAYKRYVAALHSDIPQDRNKVREWATAPFVAGLLIVAPALVVGYVYHLISSPVQSLLGAAARSLGGLVGISASLAGSAVTCMILAYILLSIVGAFYKYTKTGHRAISAGDAVLSRWKVWHAIRKLIKLPDGPSDSANVPAPPESDSETRWVWIGGGYDLFGIRCHQPDKDGNDLIALWQLTVPMPTGYAPRWANYAHTGPTGMSFAQVCAYRAAGGGPLPSGAIPPPANPPAYVCTNPALA